MGNQQGIVCWHDNETGDEGEGQPCDYNMAVLWARQMNKDCPHITHWVREAEAVVTAEAQP